MGKFTSTSNITWNYYIFTKVLTKNAVSAFFKEFGFYEYSHHVTFLRILIFKIKRGLDNFRQLLKIAQGKKLFFATVFWNLEFCQLFVKSWFSVLIRVLGHFTATENTSWNDYIRSSSNKECSHVYLQIIWILRNLAFHNFS